MTDLSVFFTIVSGDIRSDNRIHCCKFVYTSGKSCGANKAYAFSCYAEYHEYCKVYTSNLQSFCLMQFLCSRYESHLCCLPLGRFL